MDTADTIPRTPDNVLSWMKAGNERFVQDRPAHAHSDPARRHLATVESQGKHALATVLSCSDSRVPVEQIFDAGIMDLFVVRVAGNVCGPSEAGSIEYGVDHVNTPILMILGHSQCGAVGEAVHLSLTPGASLEGPISPLIAHIAPAVERARAAYTGDSTAELIDAAAIENVYQAFQDLFEQSPAVRARMRAGDVTPAPAFYDLETGEVRWLDTERVYEALEQAEAASAMG